ncbi:cytochrome P450 [Dacryopinax primogenitus]|uniref:Cytochrome P450 n=1 Tax=Dacryopinax primogenitus (strain DJM 731) TaxID=1858805 RepID=M5G921_DACPD|nr:cytochrome P450 [Dacryopinax primogenitus]EJU05224.1 cytochrome P450 [Dacryopinax primogenitus]
MVTAHPPRDGRVEVHGPSAQSPTLRGYNRFNEHYLKEQTQSSPGTWGFHKQVHGSPLEVVRNGVGDGLFTAYHGEENWGIAHRILMPAFGPSKILSMFPAMLDINSQILFKWERFGPDVAFDPTEDLTRLAFDTVALYTMSYRFNSFYEKDLPPFIVSMARFLFESGLRQQRPKAVQSFMRQTNQQYEEDIKLMTDVVDELIAHRKTHPLAGSKDLLSLMLEGKDPKTGQGLSDANIRYQLITFLIAGHETTAGTLSFSLYYLVSNPSTYATLQHEIDRVLGDQPLTLDHIPKLKYAAAVLREALRLNPPAPAIGLVSVNDRDVLGGEFEVGSEWNCVLDIAGLHRDPTVWGDDAEAFRPERMLDGKFEALPPNSWKLFGNGVRGCIGRPLAWQEAIMMLATLFQRFDIRLDDPSYHLHLKQTLTVKPKDFKIHLIPREGKKILAIPGMQPSQLAPGVREAPSIQNGHAGEGKGTPLLVLFGSDSGTCEGFAQQVASDAASYGFNPKMGAMDSVEDVTKLPRDGPVVIITSSREGQPPENAVHFVQGITDMVPAEKPLEGVQYAVFGAGNRDWARTFFRIPKLVDSRLEVLGAERLVRRGEGDAGGDELFSSFDSWEKTLWPALGKAFDTTAPPHCNLEGVMKDDPVVTVTGTTRNILLRQPDLTEGCCVENHILTAPGQPVKRHIEFQLPQGMEYRPGDYLTILPLNPPESVHRVLTHFNMLGETKIAIKSHGPTTLPTDEPISLQDIFSGYVELGQPMTQRNLDDVMRYAPNEGPERQALNALVANAKTEIFEKRMAVLDLLEQYPSIKVPLGQFIKLLPSMRIRRYSVSSSPLFNPSNCALTFSVITGPALSGKGEFVGVASNYLAHLKPGDPVSLAIRQSAVNFHLPADVTKPIVMFCAGSGLAPMRGFLQDRVEQLEAGREVGKALLFFGCRDPAEEYLYKEELAAWSELGAVELRPAFSRHPELSGGCKYVQDRVWKDRKIVRGPDSIPVVWQLCPPVCGTHASRSSPNPGHIVLRRAKSCSRRLRSSGIGRTCMAECNIYLMV